MPAALRCHVKKRLGTSASRRVQCASTASSLLPEVDGEDVNVSNAHRRR